jgi:hypothetical protein
MWPAPPLFRGSGRVADHRRYAIVHGKAVKPENPDTPPRPSDGINGFLSADRSSKRSAAEPEQPVFKE